MAQRCVPIVESAGLPSLRKCTTLKATNDFQREADYTPKSEHPSNQERLNTKNAQKILKLMTAFSLHSSKNQVFFKIKIVPQSSGVYSRKELDKSCMQYNGSVQFGTGIP